MRFHNSIALLAFLVVMAAGILSLTIIILESGRAARATTEHLFRQISGNVQDQLSELVDDIREPAAIIAQQPVMAEPILGDGLSHPGFPLLLANLWQNPTLFAAYVSHANGDMLELIATRGEATVLDQLKAPKGTEIAVRTVSSQPRGQVWSFMDGAGQLLGQTKDDSPTYDPRQRSWYSAAMERAEGSLSEPHMFDSIKAPGLTASHVLAGGGGVAGINLTLRRLQAFVDQLEISPHGGVMLYDDDFHILALSMRGGAPKVEPLSDLRGRRGYPFAQVLAAEGKGAAWVDGDDGKIIVERRDWSREAQKPIHVAVFAPESDFSDYIDSMRRHILLFSTVLLLVTLPLVSLAARRLSRPLVALADEAERICAWDFQGDVPRQSFVVEIASLAEAFSMMKGSLIQRTRNLEESQLSLEKLINLGIALSAETDSNRLMEMILQGAKDLTNADGGTLYIRDDQDRLRFRIIKNDSLNIDLGSDGVAPEIPSVPLFDAAGAENHKNVVSHSVHLQRPTSIADVYAAADFDFSGTRAFDARNGYRTQSVLTVPLLPRGGAVIGAVQLINARQRDSDEVVPFSLGVERFVQALSAMAATALYNRSLLDAQQALMDSMITSMASAIDAKSPYTGGHCARVPELAMMLAREASAASTGPLAAFRFETEEQWQEFRIGAWLHDCGKVTTPEYVVDKATKLETINNRIHELRTRFEVLLRDVEIARLQAIAAGTDPEAAEAQAAEQRAALADDFAFVAECNVGSEFMDPKRTERLKGIAERTWLRHLDDRLGLSHGELSRIAHLDPAPLPAVERLLADKPEHIIPRSGTEGMFDPRYGFKTTIPKHLYNLGELYNLSISKGTLTEEERFKVNEHIMQTIIMLEHLSFPAHLKRVPEYAGSHHETMIGTGYPRGLNAEQLSVPSRIMAIADIFEALTAADRPYKKPKTLSEAVQILWFFVKDRHIDPDLFRLFLESGIYRRYGEAFLRPEQIDEVNIAKYLAPVAVLSN